jgi:hypothetical protein
LKLNCYLICWKTAMETSQGRRKNKNVWINMHVSSYTILAVPWLRSLVTSLSPQMPGSVSRSVHVGFMVGKEVLGQDFLRVLQVSLVSIIQPRLNTHVSSVGWTRGPLVAAVQRHSLTS